MESGAGIKESVAKLINGRSCVSVDLQYEYCRHLRVFGDDCQPDCQQLSSQIIKIKVKFTPNPTSSKPRSNSINVLIIYY